MSAPPTTAVLPYSIGNRGADRQMAAVATLYAGVTANGKGPAVDVRGINGAITVEILKTGTGTFNVDIEGTLDAAGETSSSTLWQPVAFNVLGQAGALTPAITKAIGATDPLVQSLQVLDSYPTLRVNISGTAGAYSAQARVYLEPQ